MKLIQIVRSENGVGIMEALVVTVIVALSAVAFLTLQENQGTFLKRTRQVNTRDQLGNFFHGVVQDRALFLFSAHHEKNKDLRDCLGNAERGIAPKCTIGKVYPLWLIDLSDPTLRKVWTAPPATPALFDEQGQGCGEERRGQCRFEVSTTFTALCEDEKTNCQFPIRYVVSLSLKQLYAKNLAITPLNLKPVSYTHPHLVPYNQPPKFVEVPEKLWLSAISTSRSFTLSLKSLRPDFPLAWHVCESTSPDIMVQCVLPTDASSATATIRLATGTFGKTHKVRLQLVNRGPAPNASAIVEIPVSIEPTCLTPWGAFIENSVSVSAFEKQIVAANEECIESKLTCENGVLSGTGKFSSCHRRSPTNCPLPWGGTLPHGQSAVAFPYQSVQFGMPCPQEVRVCNDGVLSGSAQYSNCITQNAAECNLPWGGTVSHANTTQGYTQATVAYNQTCESVLQVRMCNNGALTGTANNQFCTPLAPRNCTTPWGAGVQHGQSVTAFSRPNVPFGQSCNVIGTMETRECVDSTLKGNFGFPSCMALPP